MIRHKQWKLTLFHGSTERGWTVQGLLYDMETDPGETVNFFDDPKFRDTRQLITERLLNWFVEQQVLAGGRGGHTLSQVKIVNSMK